MSNPIRLEDIISQVTALVKQAYAMGKADQLNSLIQAAGQQAATAAISIVKNSPERGYRQGTAIAHVHQLVQSKPGLTTKQIVVKMEEEHGVSEEKTVRTSLNRLRDKWGHLIVQREGKWFPNK